LVVAGVVEVPHQARPVREFLGWQAACDAQPCSTTKQKSPSAFATPKTLRSGWSSAAWISVPVFGARAVHLEE
jgi:hypothetical protein